MTFGIPVLWLRTLPFYSWAYINEYYNVIYRRMYWYNIFIITSHWFIIDHFIGYVHVFRTIITSYNIILLDTKIPPLLAMTDSKIEALSVVEYNISNPMHGTLIWYTFTTLQMLQTTTNSLIVVLLCFIFFTSLLLHGVVNLLRMCWYGNSDWNLRFVC